MRDQRIGILLRPDRARRITIARAHGVLSPQGAEQCHPGNQTLAILFISGINDLSTVGITLEGDGTAGYVYDGNCAVLRQLRLKPGSFAYATLFGKGVPQRRPTFNQKPSLIFNQIADADTHKGALERCAELCEEVDAPVINHPLRIRQTGRDCVSELLQGIPGVIMPKTVRFQPRSPEDVFDHARLGEFAFPFILRLAGDHNAKSMIRIDRGEDLPLMHRYPFDGRDFYLTEYVDCAEPDGRYHKQRLAVIDGTPVLRHALYHEDWRVNARCRDYMAQFETWESYFQRSRRYESDTMPRLLAAVHEVTRRLQLEYYGIDCQMRADGKMVIFEANANMNILFNDVPELQPLVDGIKQRIVGMIAKRAGEPVA